MSSWPTGMARRLVLLALFSQAHGLRMVAAGLRPSERAAVSSVIGDSVKLEVAPAHSVSGRRLLLVDEACFDEDEDLGDALQRALDGSIAEPYDPSPVLLAEVASNELPRRGMAPCAAIDAALSAHEEAWGLRRPLATAASTWHVDEASAVMNAVLDGATLSDGRWDVSAAVAVDGLVDEPLRAALLALLHSPGWDPERGADPQAWSAGALSDLPVEAGSEPASEEGPATHRGSGLGLQHDALRRLCQEELDEDEDEDGKTPQAVVELQTRLAAFFDAANAEAGGVTSCRMPASTLGDGVTPLAANAPCAADGDTFAQHIDADPSLLPPSPWTDAFGRFPNRSPGRPRFVTALVYLSPEWRWPEWGAPTRMLDPPTQSILEAAPAPGRVLLMDQDVTHSVTAPRPAAGVRPRYSLVLKLVLHPAPGTGAVPRISLPRWGEPAAFGSADRGAAPHVDQPRCPAWL